MKRISLKQTIEEIIMTMGEGNPGAINFLIEMLQENPMNFIAMIIPLDDLEIYGSDLYVLINDCCNRDLKILEKVISLNRVGLLLEEDIRKQMGNGRGKPFDLEGINMRQGGKYD